MKSIRKSTEALRLLTAFPYEISVAEVARALSVTASNASRIMAELREAQLVEQDPATRRYRPGLLAFQLAAGFKHGADLLGAVGDAMPGLVAATGHTAWAGVLNGSDVVVMKTLAGGQAVGFGVELGQRLPAHATALGKALLALLPDDDLRRRLKDSLKSMTPYTQASLQGALADLSATRMRGYAVSQQELFLGVQSVAIAFKPQAGQESVALGLSSPMPASGPGPDPAIVHHLLEAGRGIGARVGDARWRMRPDGPGADGR